jgi:hypothetical protein
LAANFCTTWYSISNYFWSTLQSEIGKFQHGQSGNYVSFMISCSQGRHGHRVIRSNIHLAVDKFLDQLWTSAHLRLAYVRILGQFRNCFWCNTVYMLCPHVTHLCVWVLSIKSCVINLDAARRHLVSYRNLCNLLITHPPAPFISVYFANYIFLFVMIHVYCPIQFYNDFIVFWINDLYRKFWI